MKRRKDQKKNTEGKVREQKIDRSLVKSYGGRKKKKRKSV